MFFKNLKEKKPTKSMQSFFFSFTMQSVIIRINRLTVYLSYFPPVLTHQEEDGAPFTSNNLPVYHKQCQNTQCFKAQYHITDG